MTIHITRATIEDVDAVAPLFDAYRRFYEQPADLPRAARYHLTVHPTAASPPLATLRGAAWYLTLGDADGI